MNERPVEDKTSKDESNNKGKGEVDSHERSRARITTQSITVAQPHPVDINSMLARVPLDTLGLFIMNSEYLVVVEGAEEVTLGRCMENNGGTSVAIDLTPYGGAVLGVSRQHAAILIFHGMYLLQDVGSSNGTWLNEVRLPRYIFRTLEHGDVIRLGQLTIHVVFHRPKSGQGSEASEKTSPTASSNTAED